MIPIPIKRQMRRMPLNHPIRLTAHHRKPRLFQKLQITPDRFPLHRKIILILQYFYDILLRQRMIPIRLTLKNLHNINNGNLSSHAFSFLCHSILPSFPKNFITNKRKQHRQRHYHRRIKKSINQTMNTKRNHPTADNIRDIMNPCIDP